MKFTLVDIYDIDKDHEVGGQDLPFRVTVKVEGGRAEEAVKSDFFKKLEPFNIQPSIRNHRSDHVEFLTFAFDTDIRKHFGVPLPKSKEDEDFERFYRSSYAKTVGELKAAIADLPDEFPLVYTPITLPGEHLPNHQGLKIHTGEWAFTGPGLPTWSGTAKWSLRIGGFDHSDWSKVMDGSWRNVTAADIRK